MADKWLHLSETQGDPWILRIWNSLHRANEDGRLFKITPEIRELGLHISTRVMMLPASNSSS